MNPIDLLIVAALVYEIASADLRGSASRDEFVATALAQAVDRVVSLDMDRIGDPSTHPLGFAFATVTMNAVHESRSGIRRAVSYDVYLILEGQDWKLWFTVER